MNGGALAASKKNSLIDEQSTFRNEPIEWIIKSTTKTRTIKSQFDNEPETEQYTGSNHFISYEGKEYTREKFLTEYFEDYKRFDYKVRFLTDNVFWLISNQRAKLQYDILAFNFPLVKVSEQDKTELEQLARRHKGETAQRWYNRMLWPNGHEKLITFGAGLEVRSAQGTEAVKGLFCYASRMTSDKAHFQGVRMDWEVWSAEIKRQLDNGRERLNRTTDKQQRQRITDVTFENANKALYYQDRLHLTIPKAESKKIQAWIYQYFKDGKAGFSVSRRNPKRRYKIHH